jgi:hypothetical protein
VQRALWRFDAGEQGGWACERQPVPSIIDDKTRCLQPRKPGWLAYLACMIGGDLHHWGERRRGRPGGGGTGARYCVGRVVCASS